MTCSALESALKTVCPDTYRDAAPPGLAEYIVWAVYRYDTVYGDNGASFRVPRVQIDAYTQNTEAGADGMNSFFERVFQALDEIGLSYEVHDTGYDPDAAAQRLILQASVA